MKRFNSMLAAGTLACINFTGGTVLLVGGLGALDPPVKGRFEHGVGTFYSDDTLRGKPIRVRFTWSHVTATAAHWEQAFSADAGKTWEVNWTTDFQRAP